MASGELGSIPGRAEQRNRHYRHVAPERLHLLEEPKRIRVVIAVHEEHRALRRGEEQRLSESTRQS